MGYPFRKKQKRSGEGVAGPAWNESSYSFCVLLDIIIVPTSKPKAPLSLSLSSSSLFASRDSALRSIHRSPPWIPSSDTASSSSVHRGRPPHLSFPKTEARSWRAPSKIPDTRRVCQQVSLRYDATRRRCFSLLWLLDALDRVVFVVLPFVCGWTGFGLIRRVNARRFGDRLARVMPCDGSERVYTRVLVSTSFWSNNPCSELLTLVVASILPFVISPIFV